MEDDIDLMRATIILMAMVLLSIIVVVSVLPIADMADYQISLTDTRSMPKTGAAMHSVHDLLIAAIFILNLLTVIWYCKLVFAKASYTRTYNSGGGF